ncbi:MAG: nitrite reductase [Anaeromyxobacter sp. RBG_16_69_14]|nr:MAG: nitrite reductase [Anaeromyxobacter sp. RBG_16_69_14]
MTISGPAGAPSIAGDPAFPVNLGVLCVKGYTAGKTIGHPERLTSPLVRNARGALEPCAWDEALGLVSSRLREVQRRHGKSAVGVFGSGALTNEKAYLLGKFARVALGTANIDYNGRFCMSSAAAASLRAFGLDRGLPFPLEDIARTDVILLAGANPAETFPPMMRVIDAHRARGGRLILIDPRRSPTADAATLHLRLTPGTDAALANGILHVLVRDGLIDRDYVASRTEGFAEVRALVATYWPERVERITGVTEAQLVEAARLVGRAGTAMVLTGRGPEQQAQGVKNVLAYVDIALALGLPGRPFSGYGCLTGQGNGQGGREHGQKADQLPGYRRIDDPAARRHIAEVWGVPEAELPGPGRSAYELLATMGDPEGVKALLVMGSNILVSAPDALRIERQLRRLDFLAVADFFLSETASQADVVLPSAQWAEEEGTTTNLEGRVIRRRRAFPPPPGVRTDLEILCALAERLGAGSAFAFSGAREVFGELRRASAGGPADYAGISYEKIDAAQGVFWPCPTVEHPGTPRLFLERFATPSGRARFHPVKHSPPAEVPDPEYPLYLTTGRVLAHYQSGTQTRRVSELTRLAPEATAHMNPATARRNGLAEGDALVLATRRGRAWFTARLDPGLRADTVFVPFHWGGEHAVNRLTNPSLDPVSRMPEFKVCAVRVERADGNGATS